MGVEKRNVSVMISHTNTRARTSPWSYISKTYVATTPGKCHALV